MPQIYRARVVFPEIPQVSEDYPITCSLGNGSSFPMAEVLLSRMEYPDGEWQVKVQGGCGNLQYNATMSPTVNHDCAVASGFGHYFAKRLRARHNCDRLTVDGLLSKDIKEWAEYPIDSEGNPILQRGNIYLCYHYSVGNTGTLKVDVRRKGAFELHCTFEHINRTHMGTYTYLVHMMTQLEGLNFAPMGDSEFQRFVHDCNVSWWASHP